MDDSQQIKIAAVADLHYGSGDSRPLPAFAEVTAGADVLLLCGDLTDRGLPKEAEGLVKELSRVNIPMLAVLGNHDYESGCPDEIREILTAGKIRVLDGEACEVAGVGFAGVKGFAGGFGRGTLQSWGEPVVKAYVQEAAQETLKLEKALAQLRTPQIIALLHYAPIRDTVEGEPAEIFPFLGCSRLEEPLNRYGVTAAFHGHAHRGAFAGKTQGGVPVYNVALSVLRRDFPDRPPIHLLQVPVARQPLDPTV